VADYYLDRQAGCDLDYYAAVEGEPRGVWCGSAAQGLGVGEVLDPGGELVLRGLLAGQAVDGSALVAPVWRGDPRGRVPAAPLIRALDTHASARGVALGRLLTDPGVRQALERARQSVAIDARLPRRPRASLPVQIAEQLASAAGLDPAEVFRGADGQDLFAAALPYAGARVDVRRPGLDLTFSAPKSVSALFGLGDERVAAEVREAHRAAVTQTVEYLESLCARAARGHHVAGTPYYTMATYGWAAVAFEHRSSRCGDPQLHTHVVVPNVVQGVDGRWGAWDTSEAYRQATTGGYIYQAVLRGELTRRLGVQWGPVRRGVAEIEGVPAELRRLFSQRRQAIEEHLDERGQSGPRAAQVATLETRRAKRPQSDDELRKSWAARATEAGFRPAELVATALSRAGARRGKGASRIDLAALRTRILGARGVTRQSSSFDRRALLRAVCEEVPAGAPVTVASLRDLATQIVRDPEVVPLLHDAPVGERRYSTAELLSTEAGALQAASARAGDGLAQVEPAVASTAIERAGLSAEQAAAVERLVSSGSGVEIVVGPAGAGKTAALRAAHEAWSAAGIDVGGAALAAIAARTLRAGTGIPSQSLTRLHAGIRAGHGLPRRGGVLVVDEAGMVGTRDLAELIAVTGNAGVKLVLVGDPAQLPEIDAGGLFEALSRSLPASVLSGNLRQSEPWERDALVLLRDGDVLSAVDAYDAAGRLHLHGDAPGARHAIVTDYLQARGQGHAVVMLTGRRVDARVLNTIARRSLFAAGGLSEQALTVVAGGRRTEWRVGDEAVVTANRYPLGLINGSRGRVSKIREEGVTIDIDTGAVTVPIASLEDGVLDYGYALTCHKAQGITVDVGLLYASGALTREAGYVGLSRGRLANHLYGTLDALMPEVDHDLDGHSPERIGDEERLDLTRAAVVQRLGSRSAQRLALRQADGPARDRVRRWLDDPELPRAEGRGR
jgi:conjugative relaxase-like TrwC/TraI family protein